MKLAVFFSQAVIVTMLLAMASPGIPPAAPFSLQISTPDTVVAAGSEVKLQVVMKNTSTRNVYYAAGLPLFDMEVRDATGKPAPETSHGHRIRQTPSVVSRLILKRLNPGESLHEDVNLSGGPKSLFDLSEPGKYTIQVSRVDPETKVLVKSNVITITITP